MNALQTPTPQPNPPRRSAPRAGRHPRHRSHGVMVGEIMMKLAVNGVLSAAAIAALSQLLPYHLSQQAKLREIRTEVKKTDKRVSNLRADFSRYFDPRQAKTVMIEQSTRVDPNQRQVVLIDNGATDPDGQ